MGYKIGNVIKCECGWLVKGTSRKHAESNLKIHKKSKKHKILMEGKTQIKKDVKNE